MNKKLFAFKDIDNHLIFSFWGIKLSFKHKCNFKYKPAVEVGITSEKRSPQVIVSLTTHPARIKSAHLAINTLLKQSFKPDRIILWLAEEQFINKKKDLPKEIIELEKFGLEIRWTEDIKSYKKLIPALKEFPQEIIVTADDDIYYEKDWLETLYNKYLEFPNCIVCQRPRRLELVDDKIKVLSSRKSECLDLSKPDYFNQMLGGAGCLYPPHSLYKDVFDIDKIFRLLPTNDDVYFWAMAVLKGTKIAVAKGFNGTIYQMDLKETSLCKINNHIENIEKKDPFKIITSKYPEIIEKMQEDI